MYYEKSINFHAVLGLWDVEFLGLLVAWRLFPYIAAPGFQLMRVLLYR